MTRLHLFIRGRVQGVFFRASTQEKARELGVTGFVKNLPDGRVEIVAEGAQPAVDALAQWAESGPPQASVERVERITEEATGEFGEFRVAH